MNINTTLPVERVGVSFFKCSIQNKIHVIIYQLLQFHLYFQFFNLPPNSYYNTIHLVTCLSSQSLSSLHETTDHNHQTLLNYHFHLFRICHMAIYFLFYSSLTFLIQLNSFAFLFVSYLGSLQLLTFPYFLMLLTQILLYLVT